MDKKEARPKGCSGRKGKKTSLGDGIDLVLQEVCHGGSREVGEGLAETKPDCSRISRCRGAALPLLGTRQSGEGRGRGRRVPTPSCSAPAVRARAAAPRGRGAGRLGGTGQSKRSSEGLRPPVAAAQQGWWEGRNGHYLGSHAHKMQLLLSKMSCSSSHPRQCMKSI